MGTLKALCPQVIFIGSFRIIFACKEDFSVENDGFGRYYLNL